MFKVEVWANGILHDTCVFDSKVKAIVFAQRVNRYRNTAARTHALLSY